MWRIRPVSGSTFGRVLYLMRQRNDETEAWWTNAIAEEDLPMIVRELLRERQVVASRGEIDDTLAWARRLPGWDEDDPALVVVEDGN